MQLTSVLQQQDCNFYIPIYLKSFLDSQRKVPLLSYFVRNELPPAGEHFKETSLQDINKSIWIRSKCFNFFFSSFEQVISLLFQIALFTHFFYGTAILLKLNIVIDLKLFHCIL